MKKIFLFYIFFNSCLLQASEIHNCTYKSLKLKIKIEDLNQMTLEVFKKKTKVSTCQFKVVYIEDGSSSASNSSLRRFEKSQCTNIYDHESRKIEIIKKGFLKFEANSKKSFAYIILNEQPLKCELSQ